MRREFRRYDHRRYGVANSRGWLLYLGAGPVLVVIGFHRGWRTSRAGRMWFELAVNTSKRTWAVYPRVWWPRAWM